MALKLVYSAAANREQGLDDVSIQLLGGMKRSRGFSFLAQDPQDTEAYLLRRVRLIPTLVADGDRVKGTGVGYAQVDLGELYATHRFIGKDAEAALRDIVAAEERLRQENPSKAAMVGVAKYVGNNGMTLEGMIPLVALKFAKLQERIKTIGYPSLN